MEFQVWVVLYTKAVVLVTILFWWMFQSRIARWENGTSKQGLTEKVTVEGDGEEVDSGVFAASVDGP